MRESAFKADLVQVGRGTPMGELLRRYWHPVGLSGDANGVPRKVRALGEDLILFRDGGGRAGLLHARCCHRGTTLYYGKVEDSGIRCCYHGWLFDAQGHCLEQPCEPQGGLFKDKVRQPWYPVEERYGLLFAYMGPPDRKPVLPAYECLEVMDEGEFVEADDSSLGGGGPTIIPCNWLQHYENVVDPFHVPVLHGSFSGPQFTRRGRAAHRRDAEADGAGAAQNPRARLAPAQIHLLSRRVGHQNLPAGRRRCRKGRDLIIGIRRPLGPGQAERSRPSRLSRLDGEILSGRRQARWIERGGLFRGATGG
jgi:phenylpropionate dioxygenase-like ring-hydroxylating dioxygenase large terminal subunit